MSADGPLLVDTGRGYSLKYGDRWLYSSRDPLAAPLRAAREARVLPETLYLVPSPCLGHGLAELLAVLPPSSAVLGLEADPALASLAGERAAGLTGPDAARLRDFGPYRPAEAVRAYRTLEARTGLRFRRCVEVRLSAGRALAPRAYDDALRAVEDDISLRFRNRLSLVRMGRLWTRNAIANLAGMDWDAVAPIRSGGRPVVVCGAGPSLDAAMPALRARRDEIFILACDTASGALASAGALPHAIVCLEAQVYNSADFIPLGRAPVPAVVDLSAHPSAFRCLAGPKAVSLSEWTDSRFLARLRSAGLPLEPVPPLGSVGVLALRVARTLGGPVILSGLDFAFPPGRTHCLGSPADLRARGRQTRLERSSAAWDSGLREGRALLEGADPGAPGLVTDPALSLYARLAAGELAEARRAGRACLDARGRLGAPLGLAGAGNGGAHHTEGTVEDIIEAALAEAGGSAPGSFGGIVEPEEARRNALRFLEGELGLAEGAAALLRSGGPDGEAVRLLSEADFLYAHFPDPERVLALEGDALKRVAAEAAYWRGRLGEAISDARRPRSRAARP